MQQQDCDRQTLFPRPRAHVCKMSALIIVGDFNKANLITVLPKFYQHVKCATRGESTLDHVYSNIKHAYRAIPLPHLGLSDHLSLLLSPAYTPLRRSARPTTKTVITWPDNALSRLQDCFTETDWDLFEHQELETFTGTVLDYIKFCIGNVTVVTGSHTPQSPRCCLQVR